MYNKIHNGGFFLVPFVMQPNYTEPSLNQSSSSKGAFNESQHSPGDQELGVTLATLHSILQKVLPRDIIWWKFPAPPPSVTLLLCHPQIPLLL